MKHSFFKSKSSKSLLTINNLFTFCDITYLNLQLKSNVDNKVWKIKIEPPCLILIKSTVKAFYVKLSDEIPQTCFFPEVFF